MRILPPQSLNKLSEDQIQQLATDYQQGVEINTLLSRYDIALTTFYKYLRLQGVQPNRNTNEHLELFSSIDTETSAYWLGFIAADGCIQTKRNQLHIALSIADYNHLSRLRETLGISNRIKWSRPRTRGKQHTVSTLDIFSQGMISDLLSLGIDERKTYSLKWPVIPTTVERHFLRGYFDGDGCWTFVRSKWRTNLSFECIGTECFLGSLQANLIANCDLRCTKLKHHPLTKVVKTLVYGGNLQCVRIANYLYEDATIYLSRKRNIVLRHYRQFPDYLQQLRFS